MTIESISLRNISKKDVNHIKARVKHPKSNGKLERLVDTIKRLLDKGLTLNDAVNFYNEERPHMSLENGSKNSSPSILRQKAKQLKWDSVKQNYREEVNSGQHNVHKK